MLINNYGHAKSQHNAHRIDFFSSIGGDDGSIFSNELARKKTGMVKCGRGTTLGLIAVNMLNFGIFCIAALTWTLWSLLRSRLSKFLIDVISSRQRRSEAKQEINIPRP
jgi:hypothetical protein